LWAGIAPIPSIPPTVRAELAARLEAEGLEALRAELAAVDGASAGRIAAADAQRTLRALEVARGTGRPLSAWLAEAPYDPQRWRGRRVGLTLPRAVLYDRIASRVDRMTARGWLEEVRGLIAAGVSPQAPAFQAIGYAQWARHLAGEFDLEEATRQIVVATRRYAKRQQTWFRREPGIEWHDPDAADALADRLAGDLAR
jgi:tRNA dimethylallyltransferase